MDHKTTRKTFKWGQNYDKDNNKLDKTKHRLLKDLSNDHIISILIFFVEILNNKALARYEIGLEPLGLEIAQLTSTQLIFLNELKYRHENNIYVEDYK